MNILSKLKDYASNIFQSWGNQEVNFFLEMLEVDPGCKMIDLGCGDGRWTKRFYDKIQAGIVVGVDAGKIRKDIKFKELKIVSANINKKLPFPENYFNVAISHFSFEHLYDSGSFIKEVRRILKKEGYIVVATDNLSSWPNIFSLLLGWQPFATTGGVVHRALGNPLALRSGFMGRDLFLGELSHNKVMAYQMLIDSFKEFNFKVEKIIGVGYFPFKQVISNIFCRIDKRHSHFLIIKARKI